jgi:hypothetical protein
MTFNEMQEVLRGEEVVDEAIFWWCFAWHKGKGSDLYRIMCDLKFHPNAYSKFSDDPRVIRCFEKLERAFGPMHECAYHPIKIDEIEEGDIIIAGQHHADIHNKWPCRVFKHEGHLCVMGEEYPHQLHANLDGTVIGFRR